MSAIWSSLGFVPASGIAVDLGRLGRRPAIAIPGIAIPGIAIPGIAIPGIARGPV
jgi:hypothetical protein